MGRSVSEKDKKELAELGIETGMRQLVIVKAAAKFHENFAECRSEVLATPEYADYEANIQGAEAAVQQLVSYHAAMAGPYSVPAEGELVSSYQGTHARAYTGRFHAAVWGRMHERFESCTMGRALLDHLWNMINVRGLILQASVPSKVNAVLERFGSPPRPKIEYDQVVKLGIEIDKAD